MKLPSVLLLSVLTFSAAAERLIWENGNGCQSAAVHPEANGRTGFKVMKPEQTGVLFTNILAGDAFLTNAVAHNGSGLALGDVDGDGNVDIYFCTLQGPNRLFHNLGEWKFEPMEIGPAACAEQFSTGAVLADVDGDGDLDLLVNGIAAGTRLFLNDGRGHWTESANSGLSRSSSPTSMALADMDGDGDLDLYCAHYVDEMHLADPTVQFALRKRGGQFEIAAVNGQPTSIPRLANRFQIFGNGRVRELPEADALYRNDGHGHFTPIQFDSGTFLNASGQPIAPYRDWGLGAMFRDLNGDGAPDLYVCNDNASPDRVWLNTGKGTFREYPPLAFRHTSRSSMGLDIADVDRDGHDDIFVADMLARDPARRLTQLVKDSSDPALRENPTEQPRYNRNALFFGRRDGTFAEAALMAGVAASDWSWCPMFLDADLDGYEDLLITTGFNFDVMDQDSHDNIRHNRLTREELKRSRKFHPRWPTPMAAFHNRADGAFEDVSEQWGFSHPAVSNGGALADLDNDGDLDLVVNNLNEAAALYRNETSAPRLQVRLRGMAPNTAGIGARIRVIGGPVAQSQEMVSGGRYMSADQTVRVFAANPTNGAMRIEVRWRNGKESIVSNAVPNRSYIVEQSGARMPSPSGITSAPPGFFTDARALLPHQHIEDPFEDWARQPLLPHRLSHAGPAISCFDLNGDGWEDLVIGAARRGQFAVLLNQNGTNLNSLPGGDLAPDDLGGVLAWREAGRVRLALAIPNSERGGAVPGEIALLDAATFGKTGSIPLPPGVSGPLALGDVDGDGDLDLFAGGQAVPRRYPEAAPSSIWLNNNGVFEPANSWSQSLGPVGLVNGATFADLDGDGAPELALAIEWGPVRLFHNEHDHFREITIAAGLGDSTGLWTGIAAGDFDGDGRLDLIVGNCGRNTAYEMFQPATLRLYYGDWNGDGVIQLVETWGQGGAFFPIRDRTKLASALPDLATRFPTHAVFARAQISDVLGDRAGKAGFLEAAHLDSMLFLNRGERFDAVPLPRAAQISPVHAVNVADYDGDGIEDVFLSQNDYGFFTDLTRDDSGRGLWLRGAGNGRFEAPETGVDIEGEQRSAALGDLNHDGRVDLMVTQNNGPAKLYLNQGAKPGLRVLLSGAPANPNGLGAVLRLEFSDGTLGPARLVSGGSGYYSQNAPAQILGFSKTPAKLHVLWPGGSRQVVAIGRESANVTAVKEP